MYWKEMPALISKERQKPMLCTFDNYIYCFMGFTQDNILDSIERINIKKLDNWEIINAVNSNHINLRFYGAAIYYLPGKLFFIGGKLEKGKNESDYKHKIYSYQPEINTFEDTNILFPGNANFIESQLFNFQEGNIGHMTEVDENDAILVTIGLSYLLN